MTKRLHFSTTIDAPRDLVWDTITAPDTYRQWTAEFTEGSYYEGSWAEGERIRFFAPNGNGMTAVIAESRPPEHVSIEHLGWIKDGVEDTDSDEVRAWAPAFENYTLTEAGGSTRVDIDQDITPEYEAYMSDVWPKALSRLKAICEARRSGSRDDSR